MGLTLTTKAAGVRLQRKYQKMRGIHLTDIYKASQLATSTAEDLKASKTEWMLSNRGQSIKTVSAQRVPKPTKVSSLA